MVGMIVLGVVREVLVAEMLLEINVISVVAHDLGVHPK